jgi:hypothetical protein
MVGSLRYFKFFFVLALALTACGGNAVSSRHQALASADSSAESQDDAQFAHSTHLTVMTYNINGIPCMTDGFMASIVDAVSDKCPTKTWYAHTIDERMAKLADFINELAQNDRLPDILLIQEAFRANMPQVDDAAVNSMISKTPYAHWMNGPDARIIDDFGSTLKTLWNHDGLLNSGLLVFSKYPFLKKDILKFGNLCAEGLCNAEKGVVYAQIKVPGLPEGIDIFNTHHQSFEAEELIRTQQNILMFDFMKKNENSPWAIAAGDFNFKNAFPYTTFDQFLNGSNMSHAGLTCLSDKSCKIGAATNLEDVQGHVWDHQFFATSSDSYGMRPVRVEFGTFKLGPNDLSDHEFHIVEYKLSW